MIETDIAYIAGLIDGEAYIGIKKEKTLRNGRVNPAYKERIQIRMVDEPAIKFLTETLGGNYHKEKSNAKNGRPLYCYAASDKLAVNILNTILPYLKVKKTVAELVLKLRNLKTNPDVEFVTITMRNRWGKDTQFRRSRHSEKHIEACEELWLKCKKFNKVGI